MQESDVQFDFSVLFHVVSSSSIILIMPIWELGAGVHRSGSPERVLLNWLCSVLMHLPACLLLARRLVRHGRSDAIRRHLGRTITSTAGINTRHPMQLKDCHILYVVPMTSVCLVYLGI